VEGQVIKSITIKGKITPYTPKWARRIVSAADLTPDYIAALPKVDDDNKYDNKVFVNGRLCSVYVIQPWVESGPLRYNILPTDEPLPPKKLRTSEINADNDYLRFCQSGDWIGLFRDYRVFGGRQAYHDRLLLRLKQFHSDKDCESCDLRFKCLTVRHKKVHTDG